MEDDEETGDVWANGPKEITPVYFNNIYHRMLIQIDVTRSLSKERV